MVSFYAAPVMLFPTVHTSRHSRRHTKAIMALIIAALECLVAGVTKEIDYIGASSRVLKVNYPDTVWLVIFIGFKFCGFYGSSYP